MKNFKISIALDSIFIFISAFFLTYAIIRYNGVTFTLSLIISVIIPLLLSFLYLVFILFKKQSNYIKVSEETLKENYEKVTPNERKNEMSKIKNLYIRMKEITRGEEHGK